MILNVKNLEKTIKTGGICRENSKITTETATRSSVQKKTATGSDAMIVGMTAATSAMAEVAKTEEKTGRGSSLSNKAKGSNKVIGLSKARTDKDPSSNSNRVKNARRDKMVMLPIAPTRQKAAKRGASIIATTIIISVAAEITAEPANDRKREKLFRPFAFANPYSNPYRQSCRVFA